MTPETLAVLRVMGDEPDADYYGLELAQAIGLKTGTIYPILARLERHGWVASAKEDVDPRVEGRPARRLYRLTGLGERATHQILGEHQRRLSPRAGRRAWGLEPRGHHA